MTDASVSGIRLVIVVPVFCIFLVLAENSRSKGSPLDRADSELRMSIASESSPSEVVQVARSYPDGGGYNRQWKGSGTPEEIRVHGKTVLKKGEGTYCCGFTLTVAIAVAKRRGLLSDKSVAQLKAFQKHWYGVPKESRETLCVYAVEKLGVGRAIDHDRAKPGDFVQFWRTNKSGHSVVFLGWVIKEEQRIGLEYRSSQASTKGIGDRIEYFSDVPEKNGRVVRSRTYFCRLSKARPKE